MFKIGDTRYRDRVHAGEILRDLLLESTSGPVTILAIPNGGIPVALPVVEAMDATFDLMIVRKIQIPGNPEAGFGAVTPDGEVFLNERIVSQLGLSEDHIKLLAEDVQKEIAHRYEQYKGSPPTLEELRHKVKGQTVVLIDDGLASGFTMLAAVASVRSSHPEKIIVAVPTAPKSSVNRVEEVADAVVCPHIMDSPIFAVASAYENWYDVSQEEVVSLLKDSMNVLEPY